MPMKIDDSEEIVVLATDYIKGMAKLVADEMERDNKRSVSSFQYSATYFIYKNVFSFAGVRV